MPSPTRASIAGRRCVALVVAAAALPAPRVVLAVEREQILEEFVEKSDTFAQTLVASGTFGFLPDVPSAYTQPLYAFFLAGLYWPFGRSWLASGSRRRWSPSRRRCSCSRSGAGSARRGIGVVAALVATLHPYVVWHDVHVNREILDGFLLAAADAARARRAFERRSLGLAAATGASPAWRCSATRGSRCCRSPLAVYVAWPVRPARRARSRPARRSWRPPSPSSRRGSSATRSRSAAPRSRPTRGRSGRRTTRRRTHVLARGQWIDDVPELPGVPPWPERAAEIVARGGAGGGRVRPDALLPRRGDSTSGASTRARRRGSPPRRWGCCGRRRSRSRTTTRARGGAAPRPVAGWSSRCTCSPLYGARALAGLFFAPRRFLGAGAAAARVQHAGGDGVRRARCATGRRWTSCSRCSPPSPSSGLGLVAGERASRPARGRARLR